MRSMGLTVLLVYLACALVLGAASSCTDQATATVTAVPTATVSPTASPSRTPAPTLPPQVIRPEPKREDVRAPWLQLANCEEKDELRVSMGSQVAVEVEIEIAEQASAVAGGEGRTVPEAVRAGLRSAVSQAFQDVYTQAIQELQQTQLVVSPDRRGRFYMRLAQQLYEGTVSFSMDNMDYTTAYAYTMRVPYVSESEESKCET